MNERIFKEEAYELLAELEGALLELEESPDDGELIGRIFRAMHTIKGSGAMFGFDDIAAFTHEAETLLDAVRKGHVEVTQGLIDLILAACDHIRNLLEDREVDEEASAEIILKLRKFAPSRGIAAAGTRGAHARPEGERATYRISFRPPPDVFKDGTNIIGILNELHGLGSCRVLVRTDGLPPLDEIDPERCYLYWDFILTTAHGIDAIKDIFIFVDDASSLRIDVIDEDADVEEDGYKQLGEILVERGELRKEDLGRLLSMQKRLGEIMVEVGMAEPSQVKSALAEQEHVRELRKKRKDLDLISSIRVPSGRLDTLVNLVGELVTVRARLTQAANDRNDIELVSIAEEVERLTEELRDNTMSIRMMPIGTTFTKFRRLVRDLSKELGREIDLMTDGAETELDKTVIERLNDPLVHLIRNSIDHGIEPPEARLSKGKPVQGTIVLRAAHEGAYVAVEVADDGAGLDAELIRSRAVEMGLAQADAALEEKDIFGFILMPGFTTSRNVTSVSGRGVGMDVVRRAVDALRGSIEIKSRRDAGTAITLRLPLTLAIIEGLLVKVGGAHFVIPLSTVDECVELTREDVKRASGRQLANVRGEIVPYISLRERFGLGGEAPAIEQIVIAKTGSERVGFVVDHVIGEHQTVIKSLGRFYREIESISGATILGDGTLALIIDVQKLISGVEREAASAEV